MLSKQSVYLLQTELQLGPNRASVWSEQSFNSAPTERQFGHNRASIQDQQSVCFTLA